MEDDNLEEEEGQGLEQRAPDSAHLVRRGALVPPKMDPDDIDPSDPCEDPGGGGNASGSSKRSSSASRR